MAVNRGQRGLLQVVTASPGGGARPASSGRIVAPPAGAAEAASVAAAAAGKGADDLSGLASQIGQYADQAAAVEGQRAGHLAGMDPEFRPMRDITIRAQAFDRAGLETAQARIRVGVENDIESAKSVEELQNKQKGWMDGGRVPQELVPELTHMFQRGTLALGRKLTREHAARVSAEATASLQAELDTSIKGLHQRAYALGLDATADDVLTKDMALIARSLRRAGPDGKPLVSPAQAQKLITGMREEVANARLVGAFERLPNAAAREKMLGDLEADFAASRGIAKNYDFDGFRKIAGHLGSKLRTAKSEERQMNSAVAEEIKSLGKLAAKGFAPTADQLAGIKARAAASGSGEVVAQLAVVEDVAAFQEAARKMPPEAIEIYASNLRREIREKGVSPIAVARVEMAETLADEARKELKADPLGWADRVGLVKLAPLDVAPDKIEASIKARIVQAEEVGQQYRQEPKYLRPDEIKRLAAAASQGGQSLMGMSDAISRIAGERAPKMLKELFEHAPVVAMLGGHVNSLGATPVAQDAADGVAIAKTDGFKPVAPSPAVARSHAVVTHKGALNGLGQTEQALIGLTNAAYEIRARRRGATEFDEGLWQSTFRELLGERHDGGEAYGGVAPATRRGGEGFVVVPPNVKQDGLRDLIDVISVSDFGADAPRFAGGQMARDADLRGARLKQAGDGKYLLNIGDEDTPLFLKGSDDKAFVLDLRRLEPVLKKRRPDLFYGYADAAPDPEADMP